MKPHFHHPITRWLDRHLPSIDTALTLACIVWGCLCIGFIGAAIVFWP